MSIEANTYEELTIKNVNEKTKEVAKSVGKYLTDTWGIIELCLFVDGSKYEVNDFDKISEGSELYTVCEKLGEAKEVSLKLRSCNNGGASWRLDSCFMKYFSDDIDVKNNVVYRSTDYYDTDAGVEAYLYDENGLQEPKYSNDFNCVADVKKWFSYTPMLRVADDEQAENEQLHNQIMNNLIELCKLFGFDEDEIEEQLEDDWSDYGEIVLNGSASFLSKDIHSILEIANRIYDLLKQSESSEFEFELSAVPNGEEDYNFAVVSMFECDGKIKAEFCRF